MTKNFNFEAKQKFNYILIILIKAKKKKIEIVHLKASKLQLKILLHQFLQNDLLGKNNSN